MIPSERIPNLIKALVRPLMRPRVPRSLSERFRHVDQQGTDLIEESLKQNFFGLEDASYLSSDEGQAGLQAHLYGRLDRFRETVVPWLNSARPLCGSRVLEIGCGTGSSTVALAEQGAEVTAVDVLEASLVVARDRCNAHNLDVHFVCANVTEVHQLLAGQRFDFIIFFAALEHMTHCERMTAMKNTWDMLTPGSLWCVTDTPNRLWIYDGHTSQLPFYSWLPDDLAFSYSRFSPRQSFRDCCREESEDSRLGFLRQGRGVSFHEFELTMRRAQDLDVVSSLPIYLRSQNVLRRVAWRLTGDRRFESVLMQSGPRIHGGFYQENLDMIIRKD